MKFTALSEDIRLEIKNVDNNKKKFKTAMKNFYTLNHFTQWNSIIVNHKLCTALQDFLL
jgi:hypothetical protein